MKLSFARLLAVLVALTMTMAACEDSAETGADVTTVPGGADPGDFGFTTTTTAPPTTTTAAPEATTTTAKPTTTTTAKEARTTTTRKINAFEVSINGDNSGKPQFEPNVASVFQGGIVRFTNNDDKPRSVESDKPGVFFTGDIPPGGVYELKATFPPGTYNYHDGTRPYAVGSISVARR